MRGGQFTSAAACAGVIALSSGLVAGQSPASSPARAKPTAPIPRTADGTPDLHGVWAYGTLTPLERPGDLAGKQEFTEEEAAEFQQQARQNRNQDRRDGAGTNADVSRAYNDFWWDFGRNVSGTQTSLVIDPADGRIPALTPEAQKRATQRTEARAKRGTADDPEDRNLWERCITRQLPALPGPYNNNVQIFQTRNHVVIVNEMIHEARVIPLDGRPHGKVRQWHGDSRGRWEGDTLVVDTINFTDKTNFRGSGANLHLTERYRLVDRGTLLYQVTVEDPTTWTKPWTVQIPMSANEDGIFEYACHEGNRGLQGILTGARAEDKARP
jgi:hypothetical protein